MVFSANTGRKQIRTSQIVRSEVTLKASFYWDYLNTALRPYFRDQTYNHLSAIRLNTIIWQVIGQLQSFGSWGQISVHVEKRSVQLERDANRLR